MADSHTLRVLNFDGGGMRGYLSNVWFNKFVQDWGIQPNEIWKYFDVICGTSIGGIAALAYGLGLSPEEVLPFFTNDGPWIFTVRTAGDVALGSINASLPSNRPSVPQKVGILATGDQFYKSVSENSNYGSARMKTKLIETFGTNTMQNLKTNAIIMSYKYNTQEFVTFSNLNYPEYSGNNEQLVNVALATSAAPLYLPDAAFNGDLYGDGGLYQNNPSELAIKAGKAVKPHARRVCLLSIGTGLAEPELQDGGGSSPVPFQDTVQRLVSLLNIAMTGAQESVALSSFLESEYTLNNFFYHRYQTTLNPAQDTELDNSDPAFLTYMRDLALSDYNEDIDAISTFRGHLTA